jgi:hypothetical protein
MRRGCAETSRPSGTRQAAAQGAHTSDSAALARVFQSQQRTRETSRAARLAQKKRLLCLEEVVYLHVGDRRLLGDARLLASSDNPFGELLGLIA